MSLTPLLDFKNLKYFSVLVTNMTNRWEKVHEYYVGSANPRRYVYLNLSLTANCNHIFVFAHIHRNRFSRLRIKRVVQEFALCVFSFSF